VNPYVHRGRVATGESLHKSPAKPTNRIPGASVQAFLHVLNIRSGINSGMAVRAALAAQFSRTREPRREGTCGHAIRRSWCLQSPSGRLPAISLVARFQVIGRFVEHQEVRRVVEHARDCQPRFFFLTGECADLLFYVFAGELEGFSSRLRNDPRPSWGKSCCNCSDER